MSKLHIFERLQRINLQKTRVFTALILKNLRFAGSHNMSPIFKRSSLKGRGEKKARHCCEIQGANKTHTKNFSIKNFVPPKSPPEILYVCAFFLFSIGKEAPSIKNLRGSLQKGV